jgi:hypothetical protein
MDLGHILEIESCAFANGVEEKQDELERVKGMNRR